MEGASRVSQSGVIETIKIEPLAQERITSEERFKIYKTTELIDDLSRGIEKLRQQEGNEDGPHLTEQEIQKINEAVNLALELHIDQKDRPSGEPYINHILSVARRVVVEYGVANPNMIMAAALHDSVEDQSPKIAVLNADAEGDEREKSFEYITSRFGERVSSIVRSLSNEKTPEDLDAEVKNRMWVEHVADVIKDPEITLVKLADFSDNALNLEKVTDSQRRLKLTKKYMPAVALFIDRIQNNDIHMGEEQKSDLVEKLKSAYSEMQSYLEK